MGEVILDEIEGFGALRGEDRLEEEEGEGEMVDVEGSKGAAAAEPAKMPMTAANAAEGTILQRLKELVEKGSRWEQKRENNNFSPAPPL